MAKNQKAKPVSKKGIRNDDRKNGKAFKKSPKKNPTTTKKTWEQRCAERKARRASDPKIQVRAKKFKNGVAA